MATQESKSAGGKFTIGKNTKVDGDGDGKNDQNTNESGTSTENKDDEGKDQSSDQNVGGESGGFKQVDQAATTLADNGDSANNSTQTNEPGKGAAPSNEGTTGEHPDNGPKATQERLDQSANVKPIEDKGYIEKTTGGPTAGQLGVADDDMRHPLSTAFAEDAAAQSGASSQSGEVIYSSHPIQNFQVGPYHFEKSVLKLDASQAADFDKLLESMPLVERKNIQKLDTSRVDDIVAQRFPNGTQGAMDSGAGRAALERLSAQFPKVGSEPVESLQTAHANLPQTDNNLEAPLNVDEGMPQNPFDAQFNRQD